MNLAGFYPFTVTVWNLFPKNANIKLIVSPHHHLIYFDDTMALKIEAISCGDDCIIKPGYAFSFPMIFGDEYIEIMVDPTSPPIDKDYQLTAGPRLYV